MIHQILFGIKNLDVWYDKYGSQSVIIRASKKIHHSTVFVNKTLVRGIFNAHILDGSIILTSMGHPTSPGIELELETPLSKSHMHQSLMVGSLTAVQDSS